MEEWEGKEWNVRNRERGRAGDVIAAKQKRRPEKKKRMEGEETEGRKMGSSRKGGKGGRGEKARNGR